MDDKLTKVKSVFNNVKEMRLEISILFDGLDGRIKKLKEMYNEFVSYTKSIRSADIKPFIFSLDSFYFQTSLLQKEYNYLKDYNATIINRMYGEYYKLLKLITEYVDKSMIDNKLHDILKNKKYPKYDDLDDAKHYAFELILQLNEDIISVVNYLINVVKDKEMVLKQYTTNQNYGLNVNNFVSTYNYEVVVLQEQINLYEKYLEFFYHVHEKLLKRLITKISVLEAQLNADVKFEGGLLSKKKDNNTLFNDLNISALDKKTARDLRKSIIGNSQAQSPENYNASDNEIEESFTSIEKVQSVYDDNSYCHPISVTNLEHKETESVAKQIFESYNLNMDEEELSNNIIQTMSISKSFELHNEHENVHENKQENKQENEQENVKENEQENVDIIPDEQYNNDEENINTIIHEIVVQVEEVNEEVDEEVDEDEEVDTIISQTDSLNTDNVELTAKQKKNAKKRQKKKEKAQKEKEENELLDKIKEERFGV